VNLHNKKKGGKYLRKGSAASTRGSAGISAAGKTAYWFITILYLELILYFSAFGIPGTGFLLTAGFSLVFACALALLTSFIPRKANFAVTLILTLFLIFLYGSQMVYYFVFKSLYTVAQMKMGVDAVTSFWRETLSTMWRNLPWLLVLLLPVIVLVLIKKPFRTLFTPGRPVWCVVLLAVAASTQVLTVSSLPVGGTGYFTNYHFYYNQSTTPTQAASRFGLLTAFRLDLFSPGQEESDEPVYYIPEATATPTEAVPSGPAPTEIQEDATVEVTEPPTEPEYNMFAIDFDALNGMTKDKQILAINNYCANITATNKNKYTGLLSDYNLVLVCGESFATGAIDPVVTPTLYRMANEGIIFNNFYNTFPNNTTDGEYALNMGLYPDTKRDKASNSFLASRHCYLPFCVGNAFKEQFDAQGYGYHNNKRDYYSRGVSHPNTGLIMKFAGSGMTFSSAAWPRSDLEMLEQSVDDYIKNDRFVAYYMTFSGHIDYDVRTNGMAEKNYASVAALPYSEPAKCYLSCNVELDKAMEYLIQRLEEAGIADKTAIVLVGDHFPYGLTDAEYSELVGYTVDDFSKYKSSALFWVGGLEENIIVDEYCCNVDILPTILNLWGLSYDSRMLAGTDVFSDSEHMAVLIDKSFYTDKVWVNASTGEIRYLVDESEIPQNYIERIMQTIDTKFSISADILNKSYYRFVFETGSSAVTRE